MTRSSGRRGLLQFASLLATLALVAACGSSAVTPSPAATPTGSSTTSSVSGEPSPSATGVTATPSATASGDENSALYAKIEADVERFRGLTATQKLDPTILDEKGVRDYMLKAFEEQTDPKLLANTERLYKAMGMLQPGVSLKQLELDLQSSQVIGFYDSDTKKLYLVSSTGKVGPIQKTTFAHEFTHALQDQAFKLDSLAIDTPDQGDRDLARLSLVEGDASLSMTQWAQARLSAAEIWQMTAEAASSEQQKQLEEAPAILRESLIFPYSSGLAFVQAMFFDGGWNAVDAMYKDPPASTSQIIHPDLYRKRVMPVKVSLPPVPAALSSDWRLTYEDTLGELQLGVWLGDGRDAKGIAAARDAVSNWGGDRVGLYDGPNGAWAMRLRTVWRSAEGQGAFFDELASAQHAAGTEIRSCRTDGDGVEVVIASDRSALDLFGACTTMG